MAQTGYTPISIYYSSTAGNTPTSGNLVAGELAINTADGKLFYKDSAGVVQVIAGKGGSGVAGGSNTQVQYNSSGSLAGSANMTFNGTTLTLANDASISGLTVGKGGGAVSSNTVVGASGALAVNTTGANGVAVGAYTLQANTTGSQNTGIGQGALYGNTTGSDNTAVGFQPLAGNTTGGQNVAIGRNALASNTTASNNTAVGYQAGYSNTSTFTGNVTAFGYQAAYSITSNSGAITALGYKAGTAFNANTGYGETFIGFNAGAATTTGNNNTFIGGSCGASNTTGSGNTFIGVASGANLTTGVNCLYVGNNATASSSGANYEMVIAALGGATGKGSSTGFINAGNGGVYQGNNSTLWSITSDQRLKKNIVDNKTGLDAISKIQVRNFEYRLPEEITEVDSAQAIKKDGIQVGAIAQELQQVLPECVKQESTGIYTVDADPLIWYLVNAVKELKAEIDQLKGIK